MRTVVYRYDELQSLADALDRAKGQGLALPDGSDVRDGEWVLAIFELAGTPRATAAAGRGALLDDGGPALLFERRDWERLRNFATAAPPRTDSETRVAAAAAFAMDRSAELPIDADTARSGVHPVEMGEPPIPADPPATGPRAPLAASMLRSTMSWESPAPTTGSGEFVPIDVDSRIPPPPPTEPEKPRASQSQATVLIVDDDEDLREVVVAMLETVGLVVFAVGSGEEALALLRAGGVDLVLLDWSLPGMSGLDLCRLVRKERALASLPLMFLTAHSATQDMVEAFAAGADDYVAKPFRAAELGARIFGLLRRARASLPSRDAH